MVYQVFDFNLNDSSFGGMLAKVNSFTDVGQGGILGIFILIVVFAPLFLMMRSYGNERAFGVSAFVTGVLAIFIRILGLINDAVLYVCVILAVIGAIFLIKEASNYES